MNTVASPNTALPFDPSKASFAILCISSFIVLLVKSFVLPIIRPLGLKEPDPEIFPEKIFLTITPAGPRRLSVTLLKVLP